MRPKILNIGPWWSWTMQLSLGAFLAFGVGRTVIRLLSCFTGYPRPVSRNVMTCGILTPWDFLDVDLVYGGAATLLALLLSPIFRVLARALWRLHPSAALLAGPLLLAATATCIVVGLGSTDLEHIVSVAARPATLLALPSALYVVQRLRGRDGWAMTFIGVLYVWSVKLGLALWYGLEV